MRSKIQMMNHDRGFGFIRGGNNDIFFHWGSFEGDFQTAKKGDEVEFEMGFGRDGKPRAINVRPI
ncbi:cold shock domain-containing protein [Bradyrhizobium sp. 27S5]|uniref:cold shock domain-containing protein n=1 Tax=Bradyrhizobium sp. 27S5 TaxID=3139728 RepID=UPI0030D0F360